MAVPLEPVVMQVCVRGGVRQPGAANLAVLTPPPRCRRGRGANSLYVAVEVTAPPGEPVDEDSLAAEMIDACGRAYFGTPGSITAGLEAALREANEVLRRANAELSMGTTPSSPLLGGGGGESKQQLSGGATCAVIHEGELFLAQAGPALAYVAHQGELTTLPEEPGVPGLVTPLGLYPELEVQFFHTPLYPGDVFLLAESSLARRVSSQQIAQAIIYVGAEQAAENLAALSIEHEREHERHERHEGHEIAALLVEVVAAVEPAEAVVAPRLPERPHPRVPLEELRPPAERWGWAELSAGVSRTVQRTGAALARLDLGGKLRALGGWLVTVGVVLLDWLRDLGRRILPGREPAAVPRRRLPRRRRRPAERGRFPWMVLAIAIPLLVILVAAGVYLQRGIARSSRFTELMNQAQEERTQALALGGNPAAREHWQATLELLTQAEALRPDDETIPALRQEAQSQLDKLDRVERLYWVGELWRPTAPEAVLGRIILAGDLYILDRGGGRVLRLHLDDVGSRVTGEEVVVQQGTMVGEAAVGELVDMALMTAEVGGQPANTLLVLERGGRLLRYDPHWGLSALPVSGTDHWRAPLVTGSYLGRFYLLDGGAGQIWRYQIGEAGVHPLQPYFPAEATLDLTQVSVIDMAIDYYIYLLFADGRIGKYESGTPVEFNLRGLREGLLTPTALFTTPEVKWLYVADPSHQRVLQLSKDGELQHQFRPADPDDEAIFGDLRSLYVDVIGGRLYMTTADGVYVANVPAGEAQ